MSEDSLNASKMNVLPGDYITTIKIYYFIHEFCLVRWKAAKNAPWMVCDGAHDSIWCFQMGQMLGWPRVSGLCARNGLGRRQFKVLILANMFHHYI